MNIVWTDEERGQINRLLNNGLGVPNFVSGGYKTNDCVYIKVDDLLIFLGELVEVAASDQKQEAYKGLRLLIKKVKEGWSK